MSLFFAQIDPETRIVSLLYASDTPFPTSGGQFVEISESDYRTIQSWPGAQIAKDGTVQRYVPLKTLEGQKAELALILSQKKAAGVYFQPHEVSASLLFPSDDANYSNYVREAQVVSLGGWSDGTHWSLPDGSTVPLSGADVVALFKKVSAYRAACQNQAASLGEALKSNLKTDLTAGWPDNK
ncbi:hypothetical protein GS501_02365 [Saccharibacter sp. 17.LH.SD]|uniref:DUF4376 domain-containing protein n=1 Tax=Saccharibacter sp. 17.LH.SD TaxID=2689393 RepID=UPI00136FC1E7|nr:DUF4376 domain-containing protein [Saccharibacter sp. 17.LH.SD]MXV43896.1 hypothetical protein [Saccharibacter sp. 17.LH.SD]